MTEINKKYFIERGNKGELLSEKVKVRGVKNEDLFVEIVPLTKADLKVIYGIDPKKDDKLTRDEQVILKCCKNPTFTEKQIIDMKPYVTNAIATEILDFSGIVEPNKLDAERLKAMDKELKKNSGTTKEPS